MSIATLIEEDAPWQPACAAAVAPFLGAVQLNSKSGVVPGAKPIGAYLAALGFTPAYGNRWSKLVRNSANQVYSLLFVQTNSGWAQLFATDPWGSHPRELGREDAHLLVNAIVARTVADATGNAPLLKLIAKSFARRMGKTADKRAHFLLSLLDTTAGYDVELPQQMTGHLWGYARTNPAVRALFESSWFESYLWGPDSAAFWAHGEWINKAGEPSPSFVPTRPLPPVWVYGGSGQHRVPQQAAADYELVLDTPSKLTFQWLHIRDALGLAVQLVAAGLI